MMTGSGRALCGKRTSGKLLQQDNKMIDLADQRPAPSGHLEGGLPPAERGQSLTREVVSPPHNSGDVGQKCVSEEIVTDKHSTLRYSDGTLLLPTEKLKKLKHRKKILDKQSNLIARWVELQTLSHQVMTEAIELEDSRYVALAVNKLAYSDVVIRLSWAGISTTQMYRGDFKLRGITKYSGRSVQELQKYLYQCELGFEISEIIDNKKIVLKVRQYLDRAIESVMQICYKKDEIEMIT